MLQQGKQRLAKGLWVVIFPEGTRIAPGQKGKYHIGGAWLAVHSQATVVPVAHNAGEFWRRNAYIKTPGVITVSIGQPIDSTGMTPEQLNQAVEQWIEGEMPKLKHYS
jgi:1-acyl-sn-glycerol-3-phosphate acyltransferase